MGRWCALELLNLRLRKHGSNCLAALILEAVARKTECRKSAKVQRALNKQGDRGPQRALLHLSEVMELLFRLSQSTLMASEV